MTGKQIKDAIDKIIDDLKKEGGDYGAVNWGDLECVSVERVWQMYPDKGEERILAIIEEAAPDAFIFRNEIHDRLYNEYGVLVDVRTEW